MSKNQELIEIKNKYTEIFKNLAKEFYDETGLFIDGVHFGYPIASVFTGEEIFKLVNTRIDVTLN